MRYVVAMVVALAGLMGMAGTAKAQGFAPRCPQACPCSSNYNWTKYSGHCSYPTCPRPIPPDPWAKRGCGNAGMGGEGFQWNNYLRSPRDFWMTGGCYPNCGR